MSKKAPKKEVQKPVRDCDHVSKRGVQYWWSPEWVRGTNSDNTKFGKIKAVKNKDGSADLYMKSKDGNLSYIQGSIQQEFRNWHADKYKEMDNWIDFILAGGNPDELDEDGN